MAKAVRDLCQKLSGPWFSQAELFGSNSVNFV
jgi:hypothetical protein